MVAPIGTAIVLAIVIGIFAIVDGIVDLIDAIRHRGTSGVGLRVFLGIVSLLFGIIILVWPGKTIGFMVILIAIWSIVIGALQIIANVGIRKEAPRRLDLGRRRRCHRRDLRHLGAVLAGHRPGHA